MEIRKASVQDLGQIMQVYDKARKFMRENGNAEQWGEDYPSAELIEHDWEGKFDFLKEYCDVVYLPRTPEISTTQIKKDLGKK